MFVCCCLWLYCYGVYLRCVYCVFVDCFGLNLLVGCVFDGLFCGLGYFCGYVVICCFVAYLWLLS